MSHPWNFLLTSNLEFVKCEYLCQNKSSKIYIALFWEYSKYLITEYKNQFLTFFALPTLKWTKILGEFSHYIQWLLWNKNLQFFLYEYEISKNKQNFVGLKILDFLWDFWAMAVTDMHPRHKLHSKSNIEKLLLVVC